MGADDRTPEQTQALEIAAAWIAAGVPVFAAPPDPERGTGYYKLPKHWEKTVPSMVNLEKWRPGWALAAVGGHAVDFLDVDPRNGGDESLAQLRALGHMPRVLAVARTPSGGTHFAITPTGERKMVGFMPGLDLVSGDPDGVGRAFVFIAPTVRPSKANQDMGAIKAYTWEIPPDPSEIAEWDGAHDPSTEPIISRVQARRMAPSPREPAAVNPGDPFMTASMARGVDRSFSMREAEEFVGPYLVQLQQAPVGEIEERCNTAATVLSHFVPNFWSVDVAMSLLLANLGPTAYDPNHPASTWTVEKFRAVLDGTRPPQDPWTATRKPDPAVPPAMTMDASPGEQGLSTVEKLRRRLVSAGELVLQPAPEPLVMGLLDMDTEAWMIGAPGSLKSFVALDLAGHVAAGREWQGHRVRRSKVLVVAAEGARGMVLRVRAYMKTYGDMEGVTFLPYPVQVQSTDGQWDALVDLAREVEPGLVILDTQARVSVGLEENSAKDMGILINAIGKLKAATGACVLTIHHTGRNGGDARGSSALDGAQDTELKVVRGEPRSALECRLKQDKQKDMAEGEDGGIPLRFKVVDLGTDPVSGRELSSLVLLGRDTYADAQGVEEYVDPRQPWLPAFSEKGKWGRRYLDTLYTFAPESRGLTKPDLDRIMGTQWTDWPKDGGRSAGPRAAWKFLQGQRDPAGDPVVGIVYGERYGVISLPVREALARELPDPTGEIELPGLV